MRSSASTCSVRVQRPLKPHARTGRPLSSEGGAGPAASVVPAPLSRTASRDRILRVDPGGHRASRRWPPRRRLRGGGDLRGEPQRGVRNERGIPPPLVVTAGRAGHEAPRPLHDLRAHRRQLYPYRPPRSPAVVECRDGAIGWAGALMGVLLTVAGLDHL